MTPTAMRAYCNTLPGTEEDVKWGCDLCFCIGKKMYAVMPLEGDESVSLKATPEDFARLIHVDGVEPAPYLARYHWIKVAPLSSLPPDLLQSLLHDAHAMVRAKLPKRVREALGS